MPFTAVGGELLFDVLSRRYERGSNLPFAEWRSVFGSERPTRALLDRLTHHVHILEMNGESFCLASSRKRPKDKETGKMPELKTAICCAKSASATLQPLPRSRSYSASIRGFLS